MIYTVTLNPALDKTAISNHFKPGAVNRICDVRMDPGGKGINVSKCLQILGEPSVAAMLLGGETGKQLEAMLQQAQIETLTVQVPGQTRTNLKIVDRENGINTDINEPGPEADGACLELLKQKILQRLNPGDLVVLSGSLPVGAPVTLYRDWCRVFQARGAVVLLDAEGAALSYGLEAAPYMVKPNEEELSKLTGMPLTTETEIQEAGQRLLDRGVQEVVISLGARGALFLTRQETCFAEGLFVPVQSTVGAGDSMVAAMAFALARDLERKEQISLAMAMGAASVMQSGSQPPDLETVRALMPRVKTKQL